MIVYFLDIHFQVDDIIMPPLTLEKYMNQYEFEFGGAVSGILLSFASGRLYLQNIICNSAYQKAIYMRGVFEGILSSKIFLGSKLHPWRKLKESERKLKTVRRFFLKYSFPSFHLGD